MPYDTNTDTRINVGIKFLITVHENMNDSDYARFQAGDMRSFYTLHHKASVLVLNGKS